MLKIYMAVYSGGKKRLRSDHSNNSSSKSEWKQTTIVDETKEVKKEELDELGRDHQFEKNREKSEGDVITEPCEYLYSYINGQVRESTWMFRILLSLTFFFTQFIAEYGNFAASRRRLRGEAEKNVFLAGFEEKSL